ncbi:tRNA synthetases class I, catalytic domain-containing protein [Hyaloraphidium curvatum]|nr:tRNA synthetases class I, catalytic domain-containing protein [Hyaloraphidium curvatum]
MELAARIAYHHVRASPGADGPNAGVKDASTDLAAFRGHPDVFPAGEGANLDRWIAFAKDVLASDDGRKVASGFAELELHLAMRSYLVGYGPSAADFAVWAALRGSPVFQKNLKVNKGGLEELVRWYQQVASLPATQAAALPETAKAKEAPAAKDGKKDSKEAPSTAEAQEYSIDVPFAEEGKVVTRFAPEPSGYLHIGHAKAVLVSDYIAKRYKGKFYVRFDDTNPSKEKMEFEQSIKEDLELMGIVADKTTHTSDYFDALYEKAIELIDLGLAYVDNTDMETMRYERGEGIKSKCRDLSVEENRSRFEEMRQGTEFGLTCALRAKISVDNPNKAMRDPVIYRCNVEVPHHITGTKWKIYPTYDFAAPVVDSLEGITHALRANEYRDRNPQYNWFFDALKIRKVFIFDYSRVNFIYTLLSKRKLKWFVEEGHVSGWDDPRFPTIRGIRRRGMTIEALRSYILSQGASQKVLDLEWDKIWATNKKVIDPVAPRFTALESKDLVPVDVVGEALEPYTKEIPKHKKNPDVGVKTTVCSNQLWLEQADAKDSVPGEEVTLMDWGNVIIQDVIRAPEGTVQCITVKLNLEGDFKKTKRKLTWISRVPAAGLQADLPALELLDYDYLITKKKLEEDEEVQNFLTPVTEFKIDAVGDRNVTQLRHGDIIQFERKGYYICDRPHDPSSPSSPIRMILIPDGSSKTVASKSAADSSRAESKPVAPKAHGAAGSPAPAPKPAQQTPSPHQEPFPPHGSMYRLEPVMTEIPLPPSQSRMYKMDSVYGSDLGAGAGSETLPTPSPTSKPANGTPSVQEVPATAVSSDAPDVSLFSKLDIRVGRILDVKRHPDADTLYVETVDLNESSGPRTVVSGLVKYLQPSDLEGKLCVLLTNLKPASMRGIKSAAMVLAASDADHTKVELLIPPEGSQPGDRVSVAGQQGEPEEQLNPKKKVFETIQPDITTTDDLTVVWRGLPLTVGSKGPVKAASLRSAVVK